MKFSLWMFLEILKSFQPVIRIKTEEKRTIENIRLFSPNAERQDHILYIEKSNLFFNDKTDFIVCLHGENYILLNTTDINLVFNKILAYFEKNQVWFHQLTSMISSNCLLKDALNLFQTVLPFPLMVLDASQTVLASSENYGIGTIDSQWDQMLTTGSFGIEIIEKFNNLHQNMIWLKTPYLVPADPFPFQSYNYNIYMDNDFMGHVTLIIINNSFGNAEKDWFDIACEAILNWFSLYADQNEILRKQAIFKELLEGDFQNMKRFINALNTMGWKKICKKRLLILACISTHLNMNLHISKLINQKTDSLYAINYQNSIVVMINEENLPYKKALEIIHPIMQSNGYYGGSSNTFIKLTDLPDYFSQAKIAVQHGAAIPGAIHACHDHILPYIFQVLKTHSNLELCHPSLLILREYDQKNHTDFCQLLYTYLQNECNQTKTAEKLNMHRNSLIRKINHLLEISHLDLNDYETRFHLLISFEYEKQVLNNMT